jgi:hypothetical protein
VRVYISPKWDCGQPGLGLRERELAAFGHGDDAAPACRASTWGEENARAESAGALGGVVDMRDLDLS